MSLHIHHEINKCPNCNGDIIVKENGNNRFTITCEVCDISKEINLNIFHFMISKYMYEKFIGRIE